MPLKTISQYGYILKFITQLHQAGISQTLIGNLKSLEGFSVFPVHQKQYWAVIRSNQ